MHNQRAVGKALGLKKETADCGMYWSEMEGRWIYFMQNKAGILYSLCEDEIPAWSLHRLICLYEADYTIKEVYNNAEECYGMLISAIGIAIEDGMFNKDYLEEKK